MTNKENANVDALTHVCYEMQMLAFLYKRIKIDVKTDEIFYFAGEDDVEKVLDVEDIDKGDRTYNALPNCQMIPNGDFNNDIMTSSYKVQTLEQFQDSIDLYCGPSATMTRIDYSMDKNQMKLKSSGVNKMINNAMYESELTHLRNIMEFFHKPEDNNDYFQYFDKEMYESELTHLRNIKEFFHKPEDNNDYFQYFDEEMYESVLTHLRNIKEFFHKPEVQDNNHYFQFFNDGMYDKEFNVPRGRLLHIISTLVQHIGSDRTKTKEKYPFEKVKEKEKIYLEKCILFLNKQEVKSLNQDICELTIKYIQSVIK